MSWKSSKKPTISDSMTKVEYIAASEAAKEAIFLCMRYLKLSYAL